MNYINNWITQFSAPLTIEASALPVSGEALTRLGLGEGVAYTLVVVSSLDAMQQDNAEILHVVGTAAGTHTLLRGREGSVAADWPAGSYVYCSITAGTLVGLQQQLAALDARVLALESGGGDLPPNALVDSAGNALVNDLGDYLTYGA